MKIKLPQKVLSILDYVIIFKPVSLILVMAAVVGGYSTATLQAQGSPVWWNFAFDLNTFINFMAPALFSGGIFILNQNNHYKNSNLLNNFSPIESGQIDQKISRKIAIIAIIISLAVLLLYQQLILTIFAMIIIAVRGYLYNFLNISRKEKKVFWIIANIIFGIMLFTYGWRIGTADFSNFLIYLAPYLCYFVSILLLIPMLEDEMLYEKISPEDEMIYFKGKKIIIWIAAILGITGFLLALNVQEPASAHALLLASVLYIFLSFNLNRLWILRTISYSTMFIVFFQGSEFPFLLVFSLVAYFISKKYYRDKFGAEYPNFGTIRAETSEDKSKGVEND